MTRADPLEPTDIWTADGRRVSGTNPKADLVEALGALAVAPIAVPFAAAGIALIAGAVAADLATATARSLLGWGGPPLAVRRTAPTVGITVVSVRSRREEPGEP